MERNQFGDMVRRARAARGLKAFELANLMGLYASQISRLENGTFKETPGPEVLAALAAHLGLTQPEMLAVLGYVIDDAPASARTPADPLTARLHAAVDAVDWSRAHQLGATLAEIMAGIRHDQAGQVPAMDRSLAGCAQGS